MPSHRTPPWEKKRGASSKSATPLTPESIEWARARARVAGRRYPNLVDNMAAVRRQLEAEHQKKFPHGLRGEE